MTKRENGAVRPPGRTGRVVSAAAGPRPDTKRAGKKNAVAQGGLRVIVVCHKTCEITVTGGAKLVWFSLKQAGDVASDGTALMDGSKEDRALHAVLTSSGELSPGVYGVISDHQFSILGPGCETLAIYQMNVKNPWPLPPPKPQAWSGDPINWDVRRTVFTNNGGGATDVPVRYTFTPGA